MFEKRLLSPDAHESSGGGLTMPKPASGAELSSPTDKLTNLRDYLPGQHESVYEFARLLAERVHPTITPGGFHYKAQLLLNDLSTGVDGLGKASSNSLTGQPKEVYSALLGLIPDIAAAAYPKEFADEVAEFAAKVNAQTATNHSSSPKEAPTSSAIPTPLGLEVSVIDALSVTDSSQFYRNSDALRKRGEAAVPGLRDALNHPNDEVRFGAAYTLIGMGPASHPAIPELIKAATTDSSPDVRENAVKALGTMGKENAAEIAPVLASVMDEPEENFWRSRMEAVGALGNLGPMALSYLEAKRATYPADLSGLSVQDRSFCQCIHEATEKIRAGH